ncbi:MAG: tocopherol cyclase family protein [Bacteroidales bacterium]
MKFPVFFPRLFRPAVYQGKRNPKNYFEGWYYKHVDRSGSQVWSIIFGISHSADPHSFIQVIEGKTGASDYIRFGKEAFSYDTDQLRITIGNNTITANSIELNLQGEIFSIGGSLSYSGGSPFPQHLLAPGIMGWYTYAPFMECYHGVVSMNHALNGSLTINGKQTDFTGGKGYIEKDWGGSMPSDWIWMQCNHFIDAPEASMMISIARIPWLNGHFPGFLSFVKVGEEVYRFATYNNSKISSIRVGDSTVRLQLTNRRNSIEVEVERNTTGQLKAPVKGQMERKIAESLDARINIRLTGKNGGKIFEGAGEHTGLEIVGDVVQYIK